MSFFIEQVHCLAGAHRAGTTGCLILMKYAKFDAYTAVVMARKCRSIIDPIEHLFDFLKLYEMATIKI